LGCPLNDVVDAVMEADVPRSHRRISLESRRIILNLTARSGVPGARIAATFIFVTRIVERSAYEHVSKKRATGRRNGT
jgi:hypothetical protein